MSVPIPTQNPNLTKVLRYKPFKKWPNPHAPAPSLWGDANYEIPLDRSMCIFDYNKTVEAIILKCL